MENRYVAYLPDTVNNLQEFRKLGEIEGSILLQEAAAKNELVQNQWILTAEKSGLLRLAKMMKIAAAEEMETERLRGEILSGWSSRKPYTWFYLLDWLDECCGAGNYRLTLNRQAYSLHLLLELSIKEKQEFLYTNLRQMIPANILFLTELNRNTHKKISVFTHGQLKTFGWTHGEIPFQNLLPYEK